MTVSVWRSWVSILGGSLRCSRKGIQRLINTEINRLIIARTMNRLRQSVCCSAHSTGAVAVRAPRPPLVNCRPLINGSCSVFNQVA